MEREGQQVKGHEQIRQGLFAVSEIVFEVVAAGLENVEGLVLDLPSGSAAGGQFGNGFSGHRQVGHEGIVIGPSPLGIQNLDGKPVDDQSVLGIPQRNLIQPAVDEGTFLAGLMDDLTMLGEFGAVEIFGDRLVRAWLAGQDEGTAAGLNRLGDRLAGIKIVAEIDRPKRRQGGTNAGQPTLGRGTLAVLLFRPVLGRDELRRQRQDPGMARSHQGCSEEGMEKIDLAVRVLLARAARAVDFARPEVLGAVERDQHPAIQTPERRQPIRRLGRRHRLQEQAVKDLGRGAVQHLPDMVVARYLLHAEQGLAVRAAPTRRQYLLMGKKRRALHEKQRKRRHPDVRHRVGAVRTSAAVHQPGADLFQFRQQVFQRFHATVESQADSLTQALSQPRVNASHPTNRKCDSAAVRTADGSGRMHRISTIL